MTPEERAKYQKILIMCAGITAVVCVIILFFFRTSVFGRVIGRFIDILQPFLYGAAIAYILRPVCLFFEKAAAVPVKKICRKEFPGFQRMTGILLSIVLMFALIVLLLVSVLPEIITSISGLIAQIPPAIEAFQEWLSGLDRSDLSHELIEAVTETTEAASNWMQEFLKTDLLPTLQSILPDVTSGFMGVLDVLKNFGLGCIIAAYILGSWERFAYQGRIVIFAVFPERIADWLRREIRYSNSMFSGFISGKILDSLIMGILCFLFMSITQMPFAVLVSVLIGVMNIIPFFGQFLGTIPGTLMILIESPSAALIFLIFMVILQQVDGNLIGPRILGGRLGISGFWILFSIILFGALMGPLGMLIGVPLFAVIYDIVRRFLYQRLRKRGKEALVEEYEGIYHEDDREREKESGKKREKSSAALKEGRAPRETGRADGENTPADREEKP